MPNSDNNEYTWTFGDVRKLDKRLGDIESNGKDTAQDVKDIKEQMSTKNQIIVDNTNKMDWKAFVAIVTAAVATVGSVLAAVFGGGRG